MQTLKSQNLGAYLGRLKWFEAFIIGYPVIAGLIAEKSVYVAPPLGNLSDFVSPLAFLFVSISAVVPWFIKTRPYAIATAACGMLLAILTLALYANCVNSGVIRLEGFNPHGIARVSIGTERSTFARVNYAGQTNLQMIRSYGHQEEDIQKLFTERSISRVRFELLYFYIGFFISINLITGSVVRIDMLPVSD